MLYSGCMSPHGIKWMFPLLALSVAPAEYIDTRQCAACHPKIAQTYAQTGMARSFYKPGAQQTVEDFSKGLPFLQQQSATYYTMLQRDGKLFQKRWRKGFDGSDTDTDELQVDYIMGS